MSVAGKVRGRVAALDIGDVWTGVALSDVTRQIARPLEVVRSEDLSEALESLANEESVEEVVVGVPKTLGGEVGFQARRVLDTLGELRERFPDLRFVEWDERFTTRMALEGVGVARGKVRRAGGRKVRRAEARRVDHLAAAGMLQEYLESRGDA